jgi:glycosyltransferase involved in cell wall biosynthesis
MKKTKTITVTVGIPAYNEEANIKNLILEILKQKVDKFRIEKIIVSSDGSTDSTVEIARSLKNNKVSAIANKKRAGIARGLNQIIKMSKSDILVTLDADIKIQDRLFIKRLISPIMNEGVDLTSSAISTISPKKRFSLAEVLNISMLIKKNVFAIFKNGENIYNCYGLARAYSKRFYKKLSFPISAGNDMYCYLAAIERNFKFRYVPEAVAWYKSPETIQDHIKQSKRFFSSKSLLKGRFDDKFVDSQTKIPLSDYLKALRKSLPLIIKNPIHILAYIIIQAYIIITPKGDPRTYNKWQIAQSSKSIN